MLTAAHRAQNLTTGADAAIRVERVVKTYRVWNSPGDRLYVPALRWLHPRLQRIAGAPNGLRRRALDAIARRAERGCDEYTALDDVSIELARGDALGIVGPNGSGKSTLLKIVAGLVQPSAGQVRVNGRTAALLELGSGFNPEFTGRENIYLNGAILGIPQQRLRARFDAIVDFAELEDFIDHPIKTYSTGMVARLAFAVQVHVDPAILIVDEALAVGDASFQAKAISIIEEILNRGTTLLFVSHDMQMVRAFCNRAIYLRKGRMVVAGETEEVTRRYIFDAHQERLSSQRGSAGLVERDTHFVGSDGIRVVEASAGGRCRHLTVDFGEEMNFLFEIFVGAEMAHPRVFVDILDGKGLHLAGRVVSLPRHYLHKTVALDVRIRAALQKGIYRVRLRVADASSLHAISMQWRHDEMLSFEVTRDSREDFLGLFPLPMETRWIADEQD